MKTQVPPALPKINCFMVASATPLTADLHPDVEMLTRHIEMLFRAGCDGIALFGTTGEGTEFSVEDRTEGLDGVIAAGVAPQRLIVSVGALSIPDIVHLAQHALDRSVDSLLLMPPCVYRGGITEDGTFRFYATVIDRIGRADLGLCLYHFPDICGVPLTPRVIRRLDEAYPGLITGVKDSGGDLDFTEALIRRFSHLSIYTGSEIHLPQALAAGARGTICGLGNAMPSLMRAMFDAPNAFDRRKVVPSLLRGDAILSRQPFPASVKAVLASASGDAGWNRVLPPMSEITMPERNWLLQDFFRWERNLPHAWQTFHAGVPEAESQIIKIRRA
ncbi:dihydrodipicolinate synthase family protein [Mesorhizobium sp. NZP2077]|uniref:dihydrodipicolinate synthase family protein n=1 Tax=Mesorhizobium sp. NZP2077 TaxID=2483404 RepID=UPI0015556C41|nr:dihydrodipicolinate synthase family protein [Mesorhizobium sp. NZP2077]QKC85495.1 dihydrodipicolinate synthase family protein [Mesorhizobium sp. NZP2077]QKD19132.1 dihydrodipicolinate synthase family protein [Mesorhizobium sp. NZP2077]